MSKQFIEDARDGMVALGIGGGDPVYPGPRPENAGAGNCATVIQTGGPPPLFEHPLRYITVQLTFFHAVPATAMARAEEAFTALHGKGAWELTDHIVLVARAIQPPYSLSYEEGLARVVFNVHFTARAT